MSKRTAFATHVEMAVRERHKADRLKTRAPLDAFEVRHNPVEADYAEREAERLQRLPDVPFVGSPQTELLADPSTWPEKTNTRFYLLDTLEQPDVIAVDASEHRASLATRAGVLSSALDAAKTAQAGNAIEKMLCHQLAAVHAVGMNLLIRMEEAPNLQPGEAARLTNAAARLFDVFQTGCLTQQKLKTGGRQHVVVQYQQQVNVGEGGQAVVAAKTEGSRRRRGGPRK